MEIQVDPLAGGAALIAVGLAAWANIISRKAARSAKASAAEAKRSSDAAEEANALATRERDRALEIHDVSWSIGPPRQARHLQHQEHRDDHRIQRDCGCPSW
jgi:hypothetical protein